MAQYFLLILLFVPVRPLFAEKPASESEILTLKRALALSFESNHQVKRSELEFAKKEDKLAAARTRRLPSTSGSTRRVRDSSIRNPEARQKYSQLLADFWTARAGEDQ